MKGTNEGDNNGIYIWNKLDTDVADSYSPPILESSDVPDLQRNRVSCESFLCYTFLDNISTLKISHLVGI